ncbi:acyl carrier protein [Actinoplanes sp. RD1]|uniref:acyl carrier protein n=1 Tax=Actinoplanes sp. RD1 TaxID=3064538 RepID=UPI0027428309|nr:acyl carrier protein [Actinoplanes sp. RD1]
MKADILDEVAAMLRAVLGEFGVDEVTPATTFRDDLGMESIDVVSLAGRLQARYGSSVNFALFLSGLDAEAVGELTVGQLADFIADSLEKVPAAS